MSTPLDTENTRKEAEKLVNEPLQLEREKMRFKMSLSLPFMKKYPVDSKNLDRFKRKNLDATEIKRIKYILLHDISKLFQEKKDEFIRSINEDDFTEDVSVDYNLDIKMRSFITTQLQQKYNHSKFFIYCIINTNYNIENHTFEPMNDNEYTTNPCTRTVDISDFKDEIGKITGVLDLKPEKHSGEDNQIHLLHLALLRQVRDIRTKFSSKILPPMMKSNNSSPTDNNSSPTDNNSSPTDNNSSPTDVESGIRQLFEKYDEELDKKTKELQKKMDGSNRDLSKYIANIEKAEEKDDDDDIDLSELNEKLEDAGQQIRNNTENKGFFTKPDEPTQDAIEKAKENYKLGMDELKQKIPPSADPKPPSADPKPPSADPNKNEAPVKFLDMWRDIDNLKNQYPDIQDEIEPVIKQIREDLMQEHKMNPLTQLMLFMHLNELFKDLTVSKSLVEGIKNRIKIFENVKPSKKPWYRNLGLINWVNAENPLGGKKTRKQRKRKTKKQKKKSNKKTKSRR